MQLQACLMCGSRSDLTVEHIIPKSLWKKFDIDPDSDKVAWSRTTLCKRCNHATSSLHRQDSLMDFIRDGAPVTDRHLRDFASWAVWVTMLLGLARGASSWRTETAMDHLQNRFVTKTRGAAPKGARVYAARVDPNNELQPSATTPRYAVALRQDDRALCDADRKLTGYSLQFGYMSASVSIRVGKLAVLVLGRTYTSGSSGRDHDARLDAAARSVNLERIHPPLPNTPSLPLLAIDMRALSMLFTPEILAANDYSLFPAELVNAFSDPDDPPSEWAEELARRRARNDT